MKLLNPRAMLNRWFPLFLGGLALLSPALLPLSGAEPPAREDVSRVILELGHEEFEIRRDAFQQLKAWSASHPRFLLTEMARAYPGNRDMEITTRLEDLMQPLATRWLITLPPGFIGINMGWKDLPGGKGGVRVDNVMNGQPAQKWGIKVQDVILELNGEPVSDMGSLEGFSERVASLAPGRFIELLVLRDGAQVVIPLRIGHRDPDAHGSLGPRQSYDAWLRALARKDEDFDPDFPVGHFPMD